MPTPQNFQPSAIGDSSPRRPRCRYAPSPTGSLHLGNARTALVAFLQARSIGADLILRIEDTDIPRRVQCASEEILDDLRWLGISWEEGPDVGGGCGPYLQSERLDIYEDAIRKFQSRGMLYECFCSRTDILRAASAPHPGEEGPIYPGTCRHMTEQAKEEKRAVFARQKRQSALRIDIPQGEVISFRDEVLGDITCDLKRDVGDFVLKRADGLFAYQLACALDDSLMGITHVLRGSDLVSSTPRQIFLMRALGMRVPESYAHIPLLLGDDGMKLSKRYGSMTLSEIRKRGFPPERVVAILAQTLGLTSRQEITPAELVPGFSMAAIVASPSRLPIGAFD